MTRTRFQFAGLLTAASLALVCAPAARATVVYDVTSGASPLFGYVTSADFSASGTPYAHPFKPAGRVIDGDLATHSDTYAGTELFNATNGPQNNTAPLDFVGALWGTPRSDVVSIRLNHFLFFDGGWFGTELGDQDARNGFANDAAQNQADGDDVAAPLVQVTSDGGASWTTIGATEDYVNTIRPLVVAGTSSLVAPVVFDFTAPSAINGVRLIGYGGGRSDVPGGQDETGFIGVAELEVGRFVATVPAPATALLLAAGVVGLRRRRA